MLFPFRMVCRNFILSEICKLCFLFLRNLFYLIEFEPQVLKKNQTSISQDIEEKILSMYAKGMTTGDIETHI